MGTDDRGSGFSVPERWAQQIRAIRALPSSEMRDALIRDGLAVVVAALEEGDLLCAQTLSAAMVQVAPEVPRVWEMRAEAQRASGAFAEAEACDSEAQRLNGALQGTDG
jgi:hypothetical protein